jgi:inner membrane protein
MPSGKTHMVAGALAGGVLMVNTDSSAAMMFAGAFGGLLPDIDHRKSILGRWGLWWLIFKHRGFTHSLIAWVLVTLLAYSFLGNTWGLGISIGYFSHLLLDFRIPWFWPRKRKRKRRGNR